jgi:cobalamin synthase
VARRLHGQAGAAAAPVILISTHAEQDYAELIAASPAVGFLAKAALSAAAIRRLLGPTGDTARTPTA